jgi:hypothetical protein
LLGLRQQYSSRYSNAAERLQPDAGLAAGESTVTTANVRIP